MIRWVDGFLDRPAGSLDSAVAFWSTVTGATPEPQRRPGYVRLRTEPPGDTWLEIQELRDGPAGTHPDLWVDDYPHFVARARDAGAETVEDHDGRLTQWSPGGLPFCVAPWRGDQRVRPGPHAGPGGVLVRPHQICLDLAPSVFDAELGFWADLTGWEMVTGALNEFRRLQPQHPIPIRFLIQRIGEERPASAHLDVSCADIPAARSWHERLGATFLGERPHWTTMRDPAGGLYCLTDGDPRTD